MRQEKFWTDLTTTKTCNKCKRELSRSEFQIKATSRDGLRNQCRACVTQRMKIHLQTDPEARERSRAAGRRCYQRHREKILANRAAYRQQNLEKISATSTRYHQQPEIVGKARIYWREYSYGLSDKQYHDMLDTQQDCCAACGREFRYENKLDAPHVDHCHKKGNVRGLLCGNCNSALGYLKDSPQRCQALSRYLIGQPTGGQS